MPISGICEIKGVGYVLAGRLEKGAVKPGEKVVFLRARQVQPVHPQCLHSGDAPSVRRAGKPRWPRGPEHVQNNAGDKAPGKHSMSKSLKCMLCFCAPIAWEDEMCG